MEKKKHGILSKPILSAFLLILYTQVIFGITGFIFQNNLLYVVAPVVSLVLLLIHKFWFAPEYKGSFNLNFLKDKQLLMWIGVFLGVDCINLLFDGLRVGFVAPTLVSLGMALTAGISEEVMCRALPVSTMMRSLKDKGSYLPALILPAVIFGFIHLGNASEGQSLINTIAQVISAGCAGMMFGAIYLRTGSILPSMIIHGLHDCASFMISANSTGVTVAAFGMVDFIELVVFSGIMLLITYFMLKGQKEKILSVWNERWSA